MTFDFAAINGKEFIVEMREQNNGIVAIDGSSRGLPILYSWVRSSAVFWFSTNHQFTELSLKVGNADKSKWVGTYKATFHWSLNMFRVYVPSAAFKEGCETVYQVVAVDDEGGRHVCGEGKLRVRASSIPEDEPYKDCKAYFEADGKWRKVVVSEDESGHPAFAVGDETDAPGEPTDIYAFDNAQGFYFKVSGVFDETHQPILALDDTPLGDGKETFVRDDVTGFYRRMDAMKDESGHETLVVGEKV